MAILRSMINKVVVIGLIGAVMFGMFQVIFNKDVTDKVIPENTRVYSAIESVNNEISSFQHDINNIKNDINKRLNGIL